MATRIRGRFLNDLTVTTGKIADAAITSDKIADLAVGTSKIAGSAVTGAKIADGAVSTAKIVDANVTTEKLAAAAITTAKIADSAVTGAKIADGAVTTAKIANGAVTNTELATDAVSESKIEDSAVTNDKLAANAVSTVKIVDGAVTSGKLAADSVDGSKIADNSIALEHMSANSVDGTVLKNTSVGESHLTAALAAKVNNTLSRITKDFAPTADADDSNTHASVAAGDWTVGDSAMVGSMWFEVNPATNTYEIWRCVDASQGAAIWVKTSVDSSELKDLAFKSLTELQTEIEIGISNVTGLQDELDSKADDDSVVHLDGAETITGDKTYTSAIIAQGGVTGNVTGNVTGQTSDLSNHLGTLAGAEEDKYVDAAELASKFTEIEEDLAAAASAFLTSTSEFTGNGSTTSYTFGASTDTNLLLTVFVGGIRVKAGDDYSLDNAGALTFSFTPEAGEFIAVERLYREGN